jgi:MFS family permease
MKVANVNTILDESNFGRTHWLMFILCLFIISFDGYDLFVYGPLVPVLMKQWGLNPAQAGIIGTYSLIGMGFGSLLFGRLGDKIGPKKMIIISATLFSTAMGSYWSYKWTVNIRHLPFLCRIGNWRIISQCRCPVERVFPDSQAPANGCLRHVRYEYWRRLCSCCWYLALPYFRLAIGVYHRGISSALIARNGNVDTGDAWQIY